MNGMKEKGRYQFNWSESESVNLSTTIDKTVTGKRKGSIICTKQFYFYFRSPFILPPLSAIPGESQAE